MGDLDEALTLHPIEEGVSRSFADPRYVGGTGMFGGWTAALLLKSVTDDPRVEGTPSSLTVHYIKRLSPGAELTVRTRPLGGTRSLCFWSVELSIAGEHEPAATGTILTTHRRPSDTFVEWAMPQAPDPETLPAFNPPGSFGEHTPVRPIGSPVLFDQPNTQSTNWVRELSGRAVDYVQLAYLADASAPRIYLRSKAPRPSSTVTMSVYFHATADELSEVGDDYVLSQAVGTRAEHSTVGSQLRLWSRAGKLLATSEQLGWFR